MPITDKSDILSVLSENRSQLMGLAMLSIMLFHQQFVGQGSLFFALFHFCGHWGVDVFMFLSGMGCYFSYRKTQASAAVFYKRRFMRIMPASLCAGTLKIIILAFLFHSFSSDSWLSLFGLDLWFIRSILILYLLFPFFQWAIQRFCVWWFLPVLVFFCLLFLAWFGSLQINSALCYRTVAWTLYRLPIFVLGILISMPDGGDELLKIKKSIVFIAFLLLSFLVFHCAISKIYFPQYSLYLKDEYIYYLLALPMAVFSYYTGMILRGGWGFLRWIGAHSLELYLVHEFIYGLVEAIPFPLWDSIRLLTAVMLSFVSAYLLKKVVACLQKRIA